MGKVTIIPQKINPITQMAHGVIKKRKVAAYARVSTESEEQATSYEAQVNYYSSYIKEKPNWEYVDVYSDEGITGTNTKRREGFNRMIKDALDGKIDYIITKSISRFARNTLDTIKYVRELKSNGVYVLFEKENLDTSDPKSELILTIMASIAQEESRSISQNVTMGKRWGVQNGKVSFAYASFLGYDKVDGEIVINPEQAEIVRLIYNKYLMEGKTRKAIADYLNENGVPTPSGKGKQWTINNIESILTNEKYKGDALLQKTYIADFLEHKSVKNNGEVAQAYVENNHPAIISREDWELVQAEIKKREGVGAAYSSNTIFSTRIRCEHCGSFYGRKVWHKGSPHEKQVFQCNGKYDKSHSRCKTPHFTEDEIKQKFMLAYNEAMTDKQRIIDDTKEVITLLSDTAEIEKRIADATTEIEIVAGLVEKLVQENASKIQDQDDYETRYQALTERYDKAKDELEKANDELLLKKARQKNLQAIVSKMDELDTVLLEWSDEIWLMLIEEAVAHENGTLTFKFKNGYNITK